MPVFYAHNGVTKLRCESKRRFWVVYSWHGDQARVDLRTDNIETARTAVRRAAGRAIYDSARKVYTP